MYKDWFGGYFAMHTMATNYWIGCLLPFSVSTLLFATYIWDRISFFCAKTNIINDVTRLLRILGTFRIYNTFICVYTSTRGTFVCSIRYVYGVWVHISQYKSGVGHWEDKLTFFLCCDGNAKRRDRITMEWKMVLWYRKPLTRTNFFLWIFSRPSVRFRFYLPIYLELKVLAWDSSLELF